MIQKTQRTYDEKVRAVLDSLKNGEIAYSGFTTGNNDFLNYWRGNSATRLFVVTPKTPIPNVPEFSEWSQGITERLGKENILDKEYFKDEERALRSKLAIGHTCLREGFPWGWYCHRARGEKPLGGGKKMKGLYETHFEFLNNNLLVLFPKLSLREPKLSPADEGEVRSPLEIRLFPTFATMREVFAHNKYSVTSESLNWYENQKKLKKREEVDPLTRKVETITMTDDERADLDFRISIAEQHSREGCKLQGRETKYAIFSCDFLRKQE